MTIAYREYEAIGGRIFLPTLLGTVGQPPLPEWAFGTVAAGDAESEFVFLQFAPTVAVTLNQGDALVWDNSYMAVQAGTGSGFHPFGADLGTFFLGGRLGDPAVPQGSIWSYTFQPGVYGIWVQRAGTSLINMASINAQTKPVNTTAVLGQLNQPASPLAGSMGITAIWTTPLSQTFTANTSATSTPSVLTSVSATKFLTKGQTVSGAGIPNGTYITDIQGPTITLSANATATATGVTITATNGTVWNSAAFASGATSIQTANIAGIYPNQLLTGTNVSSIITSITGIPGAYIINLATPTTGAGAVGAVSLVGTGYYEAFLRWPYVQTQN